jgi:hypothetical protein
MRGEKTDYIPTPPGVQATLVDGHRIEVGDRVAVNRSGWIGKVGVYLGKEYPTKKLKVRFEQHGGAVLLCFWHELRRIDNEKPATVADG